MQELPHADAAPNVHTNAKDKLRLFATNSAFCRGFEPWAVCYFKHH
jgi:hypothetical protein